jgi:hypothetical protein
MPVKPPQVDWGTAQPIGSADVDWSTAQPADAPTWQNAEVPESDTRMPEGSKYGKWGKLFDSIAEGFINNVPAIASGVGAGVGAMVAGPIGSAAGAGYGAGMGEAVREHAHGEKSDIGKQLKSAAVGTATDILGNEIGVVAGQAGKAAVKHFIPESSSKIVPVIEQAARKLTNAIGPNAAEADQFIQNAQKQVPNILEYAKRQFGKIPDTILEFHKAAQGASKETQKFFYDNILKPVEKNVVSVRGTGYAGKTIGEGAADASLGNIEKRLVQINKELSPAYRTRNAGVTGSKLASEDELNAEAAHLRNLLHNELSKSTGFTPEEIAATRQRMGQLKHIADSTNEAVTQRGISNTVRKAEKPISAGEIPGKVFQKMQGGPEAISDKLFQKAISGFHGEHTPLPATRVPAGVRKILREPLWQKAGVDIHKIESGISELPESEQKEVLKRMEDHLAERKQNIALRQSQAKENLASHGIGPQTKRLLEIHKKFNPDVSTGTNTPGPQP